MTCIVFIMCYFLCYYSQLMKIGYLTLQVYLYKTDERFPLTGISDSPRISKTPSCFCSERWRSQLVLRMQGGLWIVTFSRITKQQNSRLIVSWNIGYKQGTIARGNNFPPRGKNLPPRQKIVRSPCNSPSDSYIPGKIILKNEPY